MPYPRASAEVTKFTDAGLFDRHSKELLAPSLPYNKRGQQRRVRGGAEHIERGRFDSRAADCSMA